MKGLFITCLATIVVGGMVVGCQKASPPASDAHGHGPHRHDDAAVQESLAKLSAEDRKLAEAQGYCANEPESKLGSMGVPLKVMVKGQPVFVCCDDCSKHVLEDPEKTLATVETLRAQTKAGR